MKEIIRKYFESVGVECYSVLSYSDCKEINSHIMEREDFSPKSVIVYLLPYYTGETVNISRYAASLDYHLALCEIGAGLIAVLKEAKPDALAKGYGDHSPIDEVGAALRSGLGVVGDNGLILNEKYGSYVFIGDIVTDISPDELGAVEVGEVKRCIGCGACKRACPTRILAGEGSECLSAITQRKGELTEDEKALMIKYNTAWGCDLCQSSCPHNASPKVTPIELFHTERLTRVKKSDIDAMTDEEFSRRAFAWRGRGVILRNLEFLYHDE